MRILGSVLSAILIVPLSSASVAAQQTGDVSSREEGANSTLVRVTAPTVRTEPAVGSLENVADDSLRVRLNETEIASIPKGAVTKLEMSTGTSNYLGRGALAGAALGVGVGAVASYGEDCYGTINRTVCEKSMNDLHRNTGIAVLAGALVGGAVGATIRTRNWQDVTVEALREGNTDNTVSFSAGVSYLRVSVAF